MRPPRRLTGRTGRRQILAVAAVVAHLFVAAGVPLPTLGATPAGKPSDVPFPCQSRPCGCLTAEQCWAGACCCFSMREKVAWAAEHGFTPPAHAVQLAEREAPTPPPEADAPDESGHCAKCLLKKGAGNRPACPPTAEAPPKPVTWVVGVFAQKCQGQNPDGSPVLVPSLPPGPAASWSFDDVLVGRILVSDSHPISHLDAPLSPPPRA